MSETCSFLHLTGYSQALAGLRGESEKVPGAGSNVRRELGWVTSTSVSILRNQTPSCSTSALPPESIFPSRPWASPSSSILPAVMAFSSRGLFFFLPSPRLPASLPLLSQKGYELSLVGKFFSLSYQKDGLVSLSLHLPSHNLFLPLTQAKLQSLPLHGDDLVSGSCYLTRGHFSGSHGSFSGSQHWSLPTSWSLLAPLTTSSSPPPTCCK